MKKIVKAAVFCMLFLIGMSVKAQEQKCGENATWSFNSENKTLTISGTGAMYVYDYYSDSERAWLSLEDLQMVVIEEGITTVGNYAFKGCSSLQTISIPASVTSIGNSAFSTCTSLSSVTFADGINLTSIGNYAFNGCAALTSISLPDSLTSIAYGTFNGCTTLATISLPGNLTSIADDAFQDCTALTAITFPNGLTSIGGNSFQECGLTSVTIPASVTSVGNKAFYKCTSLTEVTFTGTNLTSIGDSEFAYCTALTTVTLPSSLTSIALETFKGCTALKTITLPNGLATIGEDSFYESGLTSVTIPASVTLIDEYAFYSCASLNSLSFAAGSTLERINMCAFYGCGLTSVTIPASVVYIGQSAFNNCSSLNTVRFAEGSLLTSIGNVIFFGCSSLASVSLPGGLESIGDNAFNGCGLTSVDIPASVSSIGDRAFEDCTQLQTVSFGENSTLSSMGGNAFYGCSELTAITLPDGLTRISSQAFYKCSKLASVTLPSGLTSIGSYSFEYCKALASVIIPASVTEIGVSAFSYCSSLTDVFVSWDVPLEIIEETNNPFLNSNNAELSLYLPKGKTDAYKDKGWDFKQLNPNNAKGFARFVEPNVFYKENSGRLHGFEINLGSTLPISDAVQSINSSEEVTGVNITYTRTFSSTSVWQAWYMPFEAVYSETLAGQCDVAQILGVFMDAGGNTYITFQPIASGTTIKANTPYVVRSKTSGEVTLTIENANLKQTQGTSFTIQSSTHNFTFGGIYEKTDNGSNGWYAINTAGNFQALGTDVYLQPMRIWMTVTERTDNPYYIPTSAPSQIMVRVLGDNTTGIGLIESDENSGEEYRLSEKIVIMNGKKYLR